MRKGRRQPRAHIRQQPARPPPRASGNGRLQKKPGGCLCVSVLQTWRKFTVTGHSFPTSSRHHAHASPRGASGRPNIHHPRTNPTRAIASYLSGSAGVEASGRQRTAEQCPASKRTARQIVPSFAETCGRSICRELSAADTPLRETSGYRSQSGIRRIDVRPTADVQQVRGRAAQMVPGLPASALSSALTSGRESGQAAI